MRRLTGLRAKPYMVGMTQVPVFRFAPSPNGRLHLGHAYSALLNAQLAAAMQGRFLLRMEDIDTTRCTPALAEACLEDLAWLGLRWEEPVRIQSQHWDDYAAALSLLRDRGLLYPCFCSRSMVASASTSFDPDGAPVYARRCAQLPPAEVAARLREGVPHSWRLDMGKALQATNVAALSYQRFVPFTDRVEECAARPQRWGDVILARKETPSSYHLSVVVDDALQGVTHVVRGADLEAATCLHRLLQALLALPVPLYHHHALLQTQAGDKLAKSKGHASLGDMRAQSVSAARVRAMVGF